MIDKTTVYVCSFKRSSNVGTMNDPCILGCCIWFLCSIEKHLSSIADDVSKIRKGVQPNPKIMDNPLHVITVEGNNEEKKEV